MKSKWTPTAEKTFALIIEYLKENWTQKEADKFANETKETIKKIEKQPQMFKASTKDKNIRKGLVNKQVSLIYKIKPRNKIIELILFWHNSRNPGKLKY